MNDSTREKLLKVALVAFLPHLPARPGLAVGLGVARRRRQILLADDLRGLCGPGCLPSPRLGNPQSIGA
jgi:hypothetical protein